MFFSESIYDCDGEKYIFSNILSVLVIQFDLIKFEQVLCDLKFEQSK